MKRLAAFLAVLVWANVSFASDMTICVFGDPQFHNQCVRPDTAIDHGDAAIDWVVGGTPGCDVMVIAGDLTMHTRFGAVSPDCDCASQGPPVVDCNEFTSAHEPDGCSACNDTEAQACRWDGVPHTDANADCEWLRMQNSVDKMEAAGIPVLMVGGNHDVFLWTDAANTVDPNAWDTYNRFFGADKLTSNAKEVGSFISPVNSGVSHFAVVEASGVDWLFIGLQFPMNSADMQHMLTWARGVLDTHPGVPTVIFTHMLTCGDLMEIDSVSKCVDGWTTQEVYSAGIPVDADYTDIDSVLNAYPQVFMNMSGHYAAPAWNSGHEFHNIKTHSKSEELIISSFHDFSYTRSADNDLPAWVTADNGGGGVVGVINIDVKGGAISKTSYSPEEDEFVVVADISPSPTRNKVDFNYQVPFCNESRFDLPDGFCQPDLRPENCWETSGFDAGGKSVEFTAATPDYLVNVSGATASDPGFVNNFTLMAWVKLRLGAVATTNAILTYGVTNNTQYKVWFWIERLTFFRIGLELHDDVSGNDKTRLGGETLLENVWYQLVVTWAGDSETTRFFINGVEDTTITGAPNQSIELVGDPMSVSIGSRISLTDTPQVGFDGWIHQVASWSSVLSPEAIEDIYGGGSGNSVNLQAASGDYSAENASSLVGWWLLGADKSPNMGVNMVAGGVDITTEGGSPTQSNEAPR